MTHLDYVAKAIADSHIPGRWCIMSEYERSHHRKSAQAAIDATAQSAAFLTSSTAKITIVGNAPTTGGAL